MSGIRKLIYIPDKTIWEDIQKAAKNEGRSASNYLIQLHKKQSNLQKAFESHKPKKDLEPELKQKPTTKPKKDDQSYGFSKKQQCR